MIRNTGGTLLAATFVASVLTQATYVRAATKYDGAWSVVIATRTGPCDASYRFSGEIVNGVILYSGLFGSINFTGRVNSRGAAYVRVSSGSNYATAYGRMTVTRGSGTWRGRGPNGYCTGTWSATRG
jgi:hypothetical protein